MKVTRRDEFLHILSMLSGVHVTAETEENRRKQYISKVVHFTYLNKIYLSLYEYEENNERKYSIIHEISTLSVIQGDGRRGSIGARR